MKIWLLKDGEKCGPYESFTVRDRISNGELKADELAWFQGAAGWMPLKEVPLFVSLFDVVKEDHGTPPPLPVLPENLKEAIAAEAKKAPPLHLVRRLFARMHDSILYISLVMMIFKERALDALQGDSLMQFLPIGLAYVLLDGLMTHVWKCSPGKFLLGLRVTDQLGHAISLQASLIRSLRVWIVGFGMWVMWPLALPISAFMARKFGYCLWDIPYCYRVLAKPFSGLHVIGYFVSIFTLSALLNLSLPQELVDKMNQQSGAQELLDKLK